MKPVISLFRRLRRLFARAEERLLDMAGIHGEVIVVIDRADGRREVHRTHNIVTDAGDIHYAQKIAAETPTNAFGIIELGTAGDAPGKASTRANMTTAVAGSQEPIDATYPKRNDDDTDNTGAGVNIVTHRFSYAKGDPIATAIDRGIITNTTPGASEPVLSYFTFAASFDVTADDTLKVFVNHSVVGV